MRLEPLEDDGKVLAGRDVASARFLRRQEVASARESGESAGSMGSIRGGRSRARVGDEVWARTTAGLASAEEVALAAASRRGWKGGGVGSAGSNPSTLGFESANRESIVDVF